MNNLIIGKNSKVSRALGYINGVEFVSHTDLPVRGTFNIVYVFSYSHQMSENERLIDNVNKINCNNVVYISSITAELADSHMYAYPTTKRKCEDIAKLFNFSVLRIGLITETMNAEPKSGEYLITSISDLETMIRNGKIECKPPVLCSYGTGSSTLQMYYGYLLDILGMGSIFLRPVDLALKLLGHNWGGYNAIIVARYRKKVDRSLYRNTF